MAVSNTNVPAGEGTAGVVEVVALALIVI